MNKVKRILAFILAWAILSFFIPDNSTVLAKAKNTESDYSVTLKYVNTTNFQDDTSNQVVFNATNNTYLEQCSSNYGLKKLSSKEQKLYQEIESIYENFYFSNEDISRTTINKEPAYVIGKVDCTEYNPDELFRTFVYMRLDHPLFYYINSASIFYDSSFLYISIFEDFTNGKERQQIQKNIEKKITNLKKEKGEYFTAKNIYDVIKSDVNYTNNGNRCHTIAGWLDGEVVCDGYASILTASLNYFGISTITVLGFSQPDGETPNQYKGHAWNMLNIDHSWYSSDLTWDDSQSGYEYFCRGKSFFYTHMSKICYKFQSGSFFYCYPLPDTVSEDYFPTEENSSNATESSAEKTTDFSSATTSPSVTTRKPATTQKTINANVTEVVKNPVLNQPNTTVTENIDNSSEITKPITNSHKNATIPKSRKKITVPKAVVKVKKNIIIIKKYNGYYQIAYKGKKYLSGKNKKKLYGKGTVKVRYAKYANHQWWYGAWSSPKKIR